MWPAVTGLPVAGVQVAHAGVRRRGPIGEIGGDADARSHGRLAVPVAVAGANAQGPVAWAGAEQRALPQVVGGIERRAQRDEPARDLTVTRIAGRLRCTPIRMRSQRAQLGVWQAMPR